MFLPGTRWLSQDTGWHHLSDLDSWLTTRKKQVTSNPASIIPRSKFYCADLQEQISFEGLCLAEPWVMMTMLCHVGAWGPWGGQYITVGPTKTSSQAQSTKCGEIQYQTVIQFLSIFVKLEKEVQCRKRTES